MKTGVYEGDVVLVQVTSSFAFLFGRHPVVCRSTPSVSHTLLAAPNNKPGESNPFDNVFCKLLIF